MGYLITAGSGLALGVFLLVWALRLKNKLMEARRKAMEANLALVDARRIADENIQAAKNAEAMATRVNHQVSVLQGRLKKARERLVASKDPATIKELLDDTLKAEEF